MRFEKHWYSSGLQSSENGRSINWHWCTWFVAFIEFEVAKWCMQQAAVSTQRTAEVSWDCMHCALCTVHSAAGHTFPSPVHSSSCRVPVLRPVSNSQQFDSVSRRCSSLLCTGLVERRGSDACRYIPVQMHAGTYRIRCMPVHTGSDAYRIRCMAVHTGADAYRIQMHAGTHRSRCMPVYTGSDKCRYIPDQINAGTPDRQVSCLRTSWQVKTYLCPQFEPRQEKIFIPSPQRPDRLWCHTALLNCVPFYFTASKVAGAWRWPPTSSSAEIKERVELQIYYTPGPSWPVPGWHLPLPFTHVC